MALSAPWLRVGEIVEHEGGPWEVEEVNVCAASIRELHVQAETVLIPAKVKRVNGKWVETKARSFTARKGRRTRISARALVKRLEVE